MPTKKITKLSAADFVHLHNHTQYSLLDGLTKIPDLITSVKKSGMQAIAITDHGTLSGVIEFYKEAKKNGIKPIIGLEAYVAARKHSDKDPTYDKLNFHLTVLAINNIGYQNLMQLSTRANLDGFYYRPRIDHDLLEKYSEGLIILSGCIGGEVGDSLRQDQYEKARDIALWYKSVFKDRYYLEIQDHGHQDHPSAWSEQINVNEKTFQLSEELAIPCVLTADAHYLHKNDQEAHEILLCVQTGTFLSDPQRMSLKQFELHVTDPGEIAKRWGSRHPEIISNTKLIADKCDVSIKLHNILIPKFSVPSGETEKSLLTKLVYQGLAWRYGKVKEDETNSLTVKEAQKHLSPAIRERAEYELHVIDQMNFNGYFLIIADFINWGKDHGIVFGPGRGSAAGSIIAYSLKITGLDPLKYDLLFERFLNPDRISMPDIDIDIQDSRRNEVIQYCIEKYGDNRVANIVTFGRMAARNAVRDVARVLQVPYAESDRLAKMIPPPIQGRHILLAESLKKSAELKKEYAQNDTAKQVFDLAVQLEGTIRSHGVHAAGVVIAPDDIVRFVPLELAQKGVIATQYSMGPIEELGLLKIDFLGLSNLTTIKNTLRIINRVFNKDIDIDSLPLDDPNTFKLLSRGDSTGVFQLESSGMKRYLKELKPTVFEDIIAMVALYRPGPLAAGLTDRFIARKNGKEKVSYDHDLMKNSLETTYGVLVYQEQVMQIAKDMCGFSGGEADTLRKAVGKKQRDMMQKMKDQIIKGAVKNKVDKKIAEKFWNDLEGFADYAFNKSHAACYGLIAYQTAYLKANFPNAFMAALMTSDFDNIDRLNIEISECQRMGIQVLPPDINESFMEFGVVPGSETQIRFGMIAIKNVGSSAVDEIIRAREVDGKFSSLEDFFSKINPRIVNRKNLESLIKTGAFDSFGERAALLANLDSFLAYASRLQKQQLLGQTDLFGAVDTQSAHSPRLALIADINPASSSEQLKWERELLGIYLSHHPLDAYKAYLLARTTPLNSLDNHPANKPLTVGGTIIDVREITTRNGAKMAFIKLEDLTGQTEIVLFPSDYQKTSDIWIRDQVVEVKGKLSSRNGEVKVTVESVRVLSDKDLIDEPKLLDKTDSSPNRIYVRLRNSQDNRLLMSLKQMIDQHHGSTEVVLVFDDNIQKQAIKLPVGIDSTTSHLDELRALVGAENIKLK